MLTGDQIDVLPMALESAFHRLQGRITDDIIRRMKANMGEITRAADWQIYRARELGATSAEIRSAIKDALKLADSELDAIYDAAIESGYARDAEIYKKTGIDIAASRNSEQIAQLVEALKKQTSAEFQNITATLGVATSNRGTRNILSLTEFYTKALDDAALDIASGAFDYNTVLKRTVKELTNSGIRHIDYDSVSKRPTTARIEVAARRAVMTGVSQLTGKIAEDNAKTLGTDMYEVTAHEGCRETHLDWQGKWYSMADLVRVCGYGDVAGLKGANCRHDFYPVIPGVDEPTYTADELAKIKEDELTPRTYGGKEYTKYEATQRQRELERTMRARRASIKALTDGGADEDDIILERASYRALSQEYTRFSKAMGLKEQRERVMIDGLGNVGAGKWTVDRIYHARANFPKGYIDQRNIGLPISKEQLTHFVNKANELGIKLAESEGIFGGFDKYCGDPTVLGDILERIKNNMSELTNRGKSDIIILRYADILDRSGRIDTGTFAMVKGRTITLNRFMYDDTEYLKSEYKRLVSERFFTPGTDYHNVVDHEMGHVFAKHNRSAIARIQAVIDKLAENDHVSYEDYVLDNISLYALYNDEIIAEINAMRHGTSSELASRIWEEALKNEI